MYFCNLGRVSGSNFVQLLSPQMQLGMQSSSSILLFCSRFQHAQSLLSSVLKQNHPLSLMLKHKCTKRFDSTEVKVTKFQKWSSLTSTVVSLVQIMLQYKSIQHDLARKALENICQFTECCGVKIIILPKHRIVHNCSAFYCSTTY